MKLSKKWIFEELQYLLPEDVEIIADDGSMIVHCRGVGWEIDEEEQAERLADVFRKIQKWRDAK